MSQRIAQLIGYTSGCDIQLDWNGSTVFTGPIAAAGDQENAVVLAQWHTDTAVTGPVPLQIVCNSNSLFFVNIYVNMWAPKVKLLVSDSAQWTKYIPDTQAELVHDMQQLTETQVEEKYGVPLETLSQWITAVETASIEDNFVQPFRNTAFNDGKNNVVINGELQSRHDLDKWPGSWHWHILEGEVFTCNFTVSPVLSG